MRILLVEDDRGVASFIEQGLEEEGYSVTWTIWGEKAIHLTREETFDLVLLDLRLPDVSGFDVCHSIRLTNTDLPILMLTALDAVDDKVRGLKAGADDYLSKPFAFDELVARIEALLRRSTRMPASSLSASPDLVVDPVSWKCSCRGEPITLSRKEFDLLSYFSARPGKALSRDDIHRDVWGHSFDRGTNLIDVYVGYIRRKLRDAGCRAEVETVRGLGYRFSPGSEEHSGEKQDVGGAESS